MILMLLVGRGVSFVVDYGIRTEQNTLSQYREGTVVNTVIARRIFIIIIHDCISRLLLKVHWNCSR